MANIKSQMKRNIQNEKNRERNAKVKSSVRTMAKKLIKTVEAGADGEKLKTTYNQFASTIDNAARKGVVHKNTAARKKSRMAKRVNAAAQKAAQ